MAMDKTNSNDYSNIDFNYSLPEYQVALFTQQNKYQYSIID